MRKRLLLAACVLVAACDPAQVPLFRSSTSPTQPTNTPPPLTAPEVVAGTTPSSSVLALSNLTWERFDYAGFQYYGVHFTLTETSGVSGAWIRSIDVVPDSGRSEEDCTPFRPVRIEPGATWDSSRLSYCLPYGYSREPASWLVVRIAYTDDAGHLGEVKGEIDLLRLEQ